MTTSPAVKFTILIVERDEETRPLLQSNLENRGYIVAMTATEAEALERAKEAQVKPDLILLNQVNDPINAFLDMGRRIRAQAGLADNVPIVLTAEQFPSSMTGQDVEEADYTFVTYAEDGQQILDLLARLCNQRAKSAS